MRRIITLLTLVVIIGCGGKPQPAPAPMNSQPANTVAEPPKQDLPVEKVTVEDFISKVKANPEPFQGKLVETSGKVGPVMHNLSDDPFFNLYGATDKEFIMCIPKDK